MSPKLLCLFVFAVAAVNQVHSGWIPWPSHKTDTGNLNWVLDNILGTLSAALVREHGDQIEISAPINNTQKIKALWIEIDTETISSGNAILRNLSTAVRVSDADIAQEKESGKLNILLNAELKLDELEVEYPNIYTKAWFFSYNDTITASCPENGFQVGLKIVKDGDSCSPQLVSAKITKLSGCSISLKNGGFMNYIKKWVYTYLFRQVTYSVVEKANVLLPEILNPIIEKNDVCKYLNPALINVS